jgi:hypothetical protein
MISHYLSLEEIELLLTSEYLFNSEPKLVLELIQEKQNRLELENQ